MTSNLYMSGKKIFIDDTSVLIEPGDLLERVTSNGIREQYEVVDPGFHERFGSFAPHYQIEVRRLSIPRDVEKSASPPPTKLHP
ncbi:unnamed protein product, partial [marine sediment metagenome]